MSPLDHSDLPTGPHASTTAYVVEQLQVYGYHPNDDEPDPRPLPETEDLEGAIAATFEILAETMANTRLEPDLPDVLWGLADVFHRKASRVQRQLDDNEQRQRASQDDQDGSEIRSVELEKLLLQGQTMIERRNVFELWRDLAGQHYESHTGSSWRPRAGSLVNRKTMTAALVDSRDFIKAKTYAETKAMLPPGPCILFSGGTDYANTALVWEKLDQLHKRFPDMVLVHGGARGAEKLASLWADKRSVPQVRYTPDFKTHGNAAPFKRNDRMIAETNAIGLVVFPGKGVTDNLADKAKAAGIRINDYRSAP